MAGTFGRGRRDRRHPALHRLMLVAVAAAALLFVSTTTAQAYDGFLHRDGTRIVDGSGREVPLRGVNLGNWLQWEGYLMCSPDVDAPAGESEILRNLRTLVGPERAARFQADVRASYTTQADFQAIAQRGYNVVRLAFNHSLIQDDDGTIKPEGLAMLDRAVDWAQAAGIYVVLDLHATPAGQNELQLADPDPVTLWSDPAAKARTVELWRVLAKRYRDRQAIAGYDLINESVAPGPVSLLSLYRRMTRAVRSVDQNHLIFYEGNHYATTFTGFPKMDALDRNGALSFHQYLWASAYPDELLKAVVGVAQQLDAPLWNGEFGNDGYQNVAKQVDRFGDFPIVNGWAVWLWKGCEQRNGHKSANDFPSTPAWTKTIAWLVDPRHDKPTAAEAEQGMQDYVRNSSSAATDDIYVDALALQRPALLTAGAGSGLTGTYSAGGGLLRPPVSATRVDPAIDFNWSFGPPAPGLPANGFDVTWTGSIEPKAPGMTQFTLLADDGVRLTIDGTTVIDDMTGTGLRSDTGRIRLSPGRHAIRVDYTEDRLGARIRLLWEGARQPREVVPASQLYP